MSYTAIKKCRICGNTHLVCVLDLGTQALTGVFPETKNQTVTSGPIRLVKCVGEEACGLLQLECSYSLSEMYGDNYGYRSGLNASMVKHLHQKIARILAMVDLFDSSIVLDIGSNDGTTLKAYLQRPCMCVGMDPTAEKFRQYYDTDTHVISDFFTANRFLQDFPNRKALVVTSFSMFYDLESPQSFVNEVAQILDSEGVWVFEQSYMPLMLKTNSYDTACHEHLEYYAMKQIIWMLSRAGLKVVDVEFNDVNGGSFSVTAAQNASAFPEYLGLADLLEQERSLDDLATYEQFERRVKASKDELVNFVRNAKQRGQRVAALGASTKGNVLLQYCGFTASDLYAVGEVNPEKFGALTPGSLIPIVDEEALLADEPDYLLVLPWHFREFFEQKYQLNKAKLVFPLPSLQVV